MYSQALWLPERRSQRQGVEEAQRTCRQVYRSCGGRGLDVDRRGFEAGGTGEWAPSSPLLPA